MKSDVHSWHLRDRGAVAVAAHDAGAANIIACALTGEGAAHSALVDGPARRIWTDGVRDARYAVSFEDLFRGATMLLSGTGWASELEHEARAEARKRGIFSVAVIDHWVNFRERFFRNGVEHLPDEIWVTDAYALSHARAIFPGIPVLEKSNPYLHRQAREAGPTPAHGDLLFVAEPVRDRWDGDISGEFQALDYLWAHRGRAGIDADAPLRIRLHPSEPAGKYDAWIAAHPKVRLDQSADVAEALRGAAWVAGLQSFALVIAMAAGRPAICALPPGAPDCPLPHRGIIHLRKLADGREGGANAGRR